LMLNHIPVLGTAFCMVLVGWALIHKSEELKRVSLGAFVIVALLAIPAYLTGEPAEEVIEHLPGVSKATIEEHEDAATFAFAGVLAVGAAALGGLVFHWRAKPAPNWIVVVVLVLSVIVFAMMIRTANLGGLIRHPELRSDFRAQQTE
jgi:fatty acid desaturase